MPRLVVDIVVVGRITLMSAPSPLFPETLIPIEGSGDIDLELVNRLLVSHDIVVLFYYNDYAW